MKIKWKNFRKEILTFELPRGAQIILAFVPNFCHNESLNVCCWRVSLLPPYLLSPSAQQRSPSNEECNCVYAGHKPTKLPIVRLVSIYLLILSSAEAAAASLGKLPSLKTNFIPFWDLKMMVQPITFRFATIDYLIISSFGNTRRRTLVLHGSKATNEAVKWLTTYRECLWLQLDEKW